MDDSMDDVTITHEQALEQIGSRLHTVDTKPGSELAVLRRALIAVLTVHIAQPAPQPGTFLDCNNCQGTGTRFVPEVGGRVHCHCGCAVCAGCYEPLCEGPCETIATIGAELGIEALAFEPEPEVPGDGRR